MQVYRGGNVRGCLMGAIIVCGVLILLLVMFAAYRQRKVNKYADPTPGHRHEWVDRDAHFGGDSRGYPG
jgi:hypothetical protein